MHLIIKTMVTSFVFLIVVLLSSTSANQPVGQKLSWSEVMDESRAIDHIKSKFHDLLDMLRGEVEPVDNICLSYYRTLADSSARFVECVANYSRPFRLCQNCLDRYLEFKHIHKLIQNDSDLYATTLYKEGLTCLNIIEATDRVQVALTISNTVNDIWSRSKCEDCFLTYETSNGTLNFTLKPVVEDFFNYQVELDQCIYNFTHRQSSFDPLFQNYSSNSSLCSECKSYYINLTKHFSKMSIENDENNMCMDVVDLFNYTRIAWSKGYKCSYRDIDQLNILIICGGFTMATVFFYIVMRISGKEEKRQFAKIYRKKSYSSINSTYSSFNNINNVY